MIESGCVCGARNIIQPLSKKVTVFIQKSNPLTSCIVLEVFINSGVLGTNNFPFGRGFFLKQCSDESSFCDFTSLPPNFQSTPCNVVASKGKGGLIAGFRDS